MKKVIMLIFTIMLFFLIACDKKITVTIHYNDIIEAREVNVGDIVNFDNLDDEYLLIGWYDASYETLLNDLEIIEDIDIYAKTIIKGTEYKINYNLNGGTFNSGRKNKYLVGEEVILTNPIKEPFYEFVGWEYNGEIITKIADNYYGDITLEAKWKDTANYYNIEYNLNNGSVKEELKKVFRSGDKYVLPIPSSNNSEEYFWGWYIDQEYKTRIKELNDDNVKSDLSLYARYGSRLPEHTKISFLGDSITTFLGYIPSNFERFYPQGDVKEVSDTWWYMLNEKLGYNILMNNSYSGSRIEGGVMAGQSDERVEYLLKDGVKPDIVVIYMGTNDYAHGTTNKDFKKVYQVMIDKIKDVCGESVHIYLCTLPANKLSSGFQTMRKGYNDVIKELVNENSLTLIDFTLAFNENNVNDYSYNDAHPNKLGMEALCEVAYDVIYNTEKLESIDK